MAGIAGLIYVICDGNIRAMLQRRFRRGMLRLVICAMLFAQAATAAEACLRASMAPAAAAAESSHCAVEKKASLNLCLYQFADQSDQSAADLALPVSNTPVLIVSDAAVRAVAPGFPPRARSFTHDPPIPIRFCSLLI
jgi:hypothetical protein